MDGIIVINKQKGCTSHDVVYKVKKIFGKKIGHTGTLDPNATGVLPILIGRATELSQFLINHDKKYIATIKLGIKTDTADVEGNTIEEKAVDVEKLSEDNIKLVLSNMIGKQKQVPPMYSAIKVNGKKLYEYARSGKNVEVKAREIEIYELNLINIDIEENELKFEIFCSKGTYVRTVCEKIAEQLGTVGYMKDLQRTMVGSFFIEDSVTIDELQERINDDIFLNNKIIGIEKFFSEEEKINLNEKELKLFLNGVMLNKELKSGLVRVYNENNKFIGIASSEYGKLKRKIICD